MRSIFSRLFAASLVLTPLAASAQVSAGDPPSASPSASAAAEALFQQGRALLAEGRTAEACERLAGSQRLEAKLGTLLNLALCHETLGLHATAWAEFTSAATIAGREGQAERQAFAREHIATLQAKLSTLTVKLQASVPGAVVTVDGQPFPAIGAPLPIDPGQHEVAVAAPGKQTWKRTVEVESDRQAYDVVVPALSDVGAVSHAAAPSTRPPADERGGQGDDGGGVPPVAIVAFSISGAALVVGAATGIVTLGMTSDIEENCTSDVCPADQESDIDSAEKTANVSNASFLIALVGAGVGIGAILLSDGPKEKTATMVEPTIGLGSLGARGRF